ncbi:MAG TPA: heme lyase CcmF/NrfE family subunit [Longimicrobiales bacterium]
MTGAIGHTAVALALALSCYGVIAAVVGGRKGREGRAWHASARGAAYAVLLMYAVATFAMVYALVAHDFSVAYVAQVGSRSTPLFFTVISLWGALEGSILFWGFVLALYTALVAYGGRRGAQADSQRTYATGTLLAVSAFFSLLLVGPANPFAPVYPVPLDGPGPNPLLQNHPLMAVHPPLLYLGYVGFAVPFAFAAGTLLAGREDEGWIRESRRWTLVAWGFQSAAIVAGMWWSYEVLGWGGYWAWDPVENASFMPWLTATAFLHSSMVEERRPGMLRLWNLSLVVATFLLTILGTFLTRSGVLLSVHAFTQGPIGYYFLGFIALALVFSLALLAARSDRLGRGQGHLDSAVSREAVFLVNNLLLTAFTFTVLLGTLFPLVAEAVRGVKVSVGAPFFNRMTVPLCVALLFLVGVGPALPWRGIRAAAAARDLLLPSLGCLAAALGSVLLLGVRDAYAALAFGFAAFALLSNAREFVEGTRARRRATGESWPFALARLVRANRHRYGGYLAHVGVVSVAIAITASSTFRQEREATLRPGEAVDLGPYAVRFERLWAREEPHRFVIGADLAVLVDGEPAGRLDPRLNFYRTSEQPITTPAVRSRAGGDLYVNLLAFERDGSSATLHVISEPLVPWIWIGGGIICLGALIAAWPESRRRRLIRAARRPGADEEAGDRQPPQTAASAIAQGAAR